MPTAEPDNPLGLYLRDRRAKLDPAAFGFSLSRRRTPGLRREEVAQRANVSSTWYTWLEQGRGGAPSADVLDRIARAMMLTEVEREHLFLLGLGRPPEVRYRANDVTPRLQHVLDALDPVPAVIRTALWDVVAWNRAATVMLVDYDALPPADRNILRFAFLHPHMRSSQGDWEALARFIIGSFRADVARAGATAAAEPLVEELCQTSAEFRAFWQDKNIQGPHGEVIKRIRHPLIGPLAFEYSTFSVDGRRDLNLVVYNPATAEDAAGIQALVETKRGSGKTRTKAAV